MKIQRNPAIFLLFVLLASFGAWIPEQVTVSTTYSLNKSVFWESNTRPRKMDYAVFYFNDNKYLSEKNIKDTFTKKLVCYSGDMLEFTKGQFYCNGEVIAQPVEKDSAGKTLPKFRHNGIIPEDMAFALGTNPYSGDSRYFGLINVSKAKRVIPLW